MEAVEMEEKRRNENKRGGVKKDDEKVRMEAVEMEGSTQWVPLCQAAVQPSSHARCSVIQ